MRRVVIVGGGISGLATAFYLRRARPDLAVTILESRPRLGGVIVTRRQNGFLIEGGPDSFVTSKPWGLQLCRDLGMEDRLIPTDPAHRKVYVLWKGRLEPLPDGLFLAVPTRLGPLLRSSLLSWPGKIRLGMDLVLPRGGGSQDESLGSFVRRRLGREAVERIAEPILGGIYLAGADRLSLRSTFPRLLEMEHAHRSLLLAIRRESRPDGGASPFRAPAGGMGELVEALRRAMPEVEFRTETKVLRIEPSLSVLTGDGTLPADALVLAVPPPDCAAIVRGVSPALAEMIAAIPTRSSATVALGYRNPRPAVRLDGTGFVIAAGENRRILACTWSSKKFAGRAPEGDLLVRCFLGGKDEEMQAESDTALVRVAREELTSLLGLGEDPAVSAVFRWPGANPVYEVGHEARVREIEALVDPAMNLHLCGSGFRGVGIPDCVRDAMSVAGKIAQRL